MSPNVLGYSVLNDDLPMQNVYIRTAKRVPYGHPTEATLQVQANPLWPLSKVKRSGYMERIATGPERASAIKSEESTCESEEDR